MAITALVTPGETYPDSTNITRAMLRNGAAPAIAISGKIETGDVASNAQITFGQLEPLANGSVVVGNASSVAAAVALGTGASLTSGGVLTPSTGTITGSHLVTGSTNTINGLGTTLSSVAGGDLVMINDISDNTLQKVTVTNLLNAGVDTTSQSTTDLANLTSGATVATIDFDANPVQYVEITTATSVTFELDNLPDGSEPSGTAKSVSVIVYNNSGNAVTLGFTGGWKFLKAAPTQIADTKYAVLAITAISSSRVISAYAAEN
jgi:hypothetical protein